MNRRAELAEILRTEYGIGSKAELEKAIAKLGGLDISLFCAEIKKTRRSSNEKKGSKDKKVLLGAEMVRSDPDGIGYDLRTPYPGGI